MTFRNALASIAAVSLIAAPVIAQAAARETAPIERESADIEGEQLSGSPWIPILAVFLVLAALLALSSGGGDEPVSP